jgi:putative oxidoreductase
MKNPLNPFLDTLSRPMDVAGRVLLGLYFLVPGLSKVTGFAGTLAYMELHGVPLALPVLLLTIPLQVGGGLALIANWNARTSAFLLAGMTLLINVFMHDFWNDYPGGNPQHELQNFIKNLGIFAGLLLLAARHPEQQSAAGRP